MDTKDIVLLAAMIMAVGFSLYRKYMKKNQEKFTGPSQGKDDSSFRRTSPEDEYEPYSKK